ARLAARGVVRGAGPPHGGRRPGAVARPAGAGAGAACGWLERLATATPGRETLQVLLSSLSPGCGREGGRPQQRAPTTSTLPLHHPAQSQPFFGAPAWGGRALARFLGKNLPPGRCGESWEVSDHPSHVSVLATGTLFGHTLRQLMEQHSAELLGDA